MTLPKGRPLSAPAVSVVAASSESSSAFASTRSSRRTPSWQARSTIPDTPQAERGALSPQSSTPEIPARLVGAWVGQALAMLSRSLPSPGPRRGTKSEGAPSGRIAPRQLSAPARVSAQGPRAWIRAAPRPVREEVERQAVREARTLLGSPRRSFGRALIRRAVELTEAQLLPGRRKAAVWRPPGPGRRVPRGVRSVGSMREARPGRDAAGYLQRAGVPFDPEANPRRRKRRAGDRLLGRRGGAYVFRVNGIRLSAAERIVAGLHAEGLRAAAALRSRVARAVAGRRPPSTPDPAAAVRHTRHWEMIFPQVISLASDPPAVLADLLGHARRHGAAVALLYMPVPGRLSRAASHAVALSVVPTPRGPSANTFRAALYDPNGEITYKRGVLEAWLRAAATDREARIRLEQCSGLRGVAVQYRAEGSCVPGALALILRLAAMRGNRRGGCALPYQRLLKEDAVLAAQLVTWYGVFLAE